MSILTKSKELLHYDALLAVLATMLPDDNDNNLHVYSLKDGRTGLNFLIEFNSDRHCYVEFKDNVSWFVAYLQLSGGQGELMAFEMNASELSKIAKIIADFIYNNKQPAF